MNITRSAFFIALPLLLMACNDTESNTRTLTHEVHVKVIPFGKSTESMNLDFSGTLQENRAVPISFLVSGRAVSLYVKDGDTVHVGKLLAAVDSASLVDALQMNQAKLTQAQDAFNRMKPMHDSGAVPEVKFVEVQTGLAQAQAMVNLSRKNLDDARLVAPVNGIVVKKNLEIGQSVTPGISVLTLVDPRFLDAVFSVPETEVLHIHIGMSMHISLPGPSEEALTGTITEVAIQADPVSRNYPIRVKLDNRTGNLRMGMACHGILTLAGKANTQEQAVLPLQAVLENPNGTRFVYVVENGKAVAHEITIGGFIGNGLRVLSGLKIGDLVVIEGAHGISNGLAVKY